MPEAKPTGKPDAGNLHVRFDEGEGYALPTLLVKKLLQSSSAVLSLFGSHGKSHCSRYL